jgi:predicted Zn-dependent protease
MAARAVLLALACALAPAGTGCIQDDGSRFNPFDRKLLGEDEERQQGREIDREIQRHVRILEDPVVNAFVNDLGQHIVRQIEPQPFIYRFRVIEDPSLNAFAIPGGYIYFHSGTLLAAGDVEELAGVMSHEIAHVKRRHYARGVQKNTLPSLLATIAGLGVTLATGEPAAAVVAQGANVALQLRWTREFEAEADATGAIFASRAGYDPLGLVRFFERLLVERDRYPTSAPPYLYSHPEVEDRIDSVVEIAAELKPRSAPPPELERQLRDSQLRIGLLADSGRSVLPLPALPVDREVTDAALAEAARLAEAGEDEAALAELREAEQSQPYDPRLPFQEGELLAAQERHEEAVAAYRRALVLDPMTAQLVFRLGLEYKALGDRQRAVYYLEQALRRFGPQSALRKQAEWEIVKLTFPVLSEAGLADGSEHEDADTVAGFSHEAFQPTDPRVVWWGRVNRRYLDETEKLRVRWRSPDGEIVHEGPVAQEHRVYVRAALELRELAPEGAVIGLWTVEALLEGDIVDRRTFPVQP